MIEGMEWIGRVKKGYSSVLWEVATIAGKSDMLCNHRLPRTDRLGKRKGSVCLAQLWSAVVVPGHGCGPLLRYLLLVLSTPPKTRQRAEWTVIGYF
jgi:hypothetical protein